MANINPQFKLKHSSSSNPTLILLIAYFNRQRFVYSTGKKILPELWDNESQRPTKDRGIINKYLNASPDLKNEMKDLSSILNRYADEARKSYGYLEQQDLIPTPDKVRELLDKKFKPLLNQIKDKTKVTLNTYIKTYIDKIESGKRLVVEGINKGQLYKKGTIKNYKGFKVQFDSFQDEKRKLSNFDDITIDFYDEFVSYFVKKGYSANTIGRHIKNLKTIMRSAREEGFHNNQEIDRKKFKVIREETDSIYLTESELNKMYQLDLSENITLDIARDVFLVGCRTAQRFSDYSLISKENLIHIEYKNVIDLLQKKTGERVKIPLHWQVTEILKKHDGYLPKIYEQKLNSRIKEVGRLAGINESVLTQEIKGGLKVKKTAPKYELIKTHTARRTGCTLMYKAGIQVIDIMKISGHKTEREFLKYIRVSKEETAILLSDHPYYKQPIKLA